MIDLNLELAGKLCIHGFNHLADRDVKTAQGGVAIAFVDYVEEWL